MSPQSLLDRIGDWSTGLRYGLLTVIALAFFLPGLFSLPPIDRDESRFAQASKQMVETGDYIDIRFQGEPRHKKPAGIYWAQTLAVHLTGIRDEIWVYRMPSLLAAVASVLLTACIGGLLFTGGVGFGAGLVMASSTWERWPACCWHCADAGVTVPPMASGHWPVPVSWSRDRSCSCR